MASIESLDEEKWTTALSRWVGYVALGWVTYLIYRTSGISVWDQVVRLVGRKPKDAPKIRVIPATPSSPDKNIEALFSEQTSRKVTPVHKQEQPATSPLVSECSVVRRGTQQKPKFILQTPKRTRNVSESKDKSTTDLPFNQESGQQENVETQKSELDNHNESSVTQKTPVSAEEIADATNRFHVTRCSFSVDKAVSIGLKILTPEDVCPPGTIIATDPFSALSPANNSNSTENSSAPDVNKQHVKKSSARKTVCFKDANGNEDCSTPSASVQPLDTSNTELTFETNPATEGGCGQSGMTSQPALHAYTSTNNIASALSAAADQQEQQALTRDQKMTAQYHATLKTHTNLNSQLFQQSSKDTAANDSVGQTDEPRSTTGADRRTGGDPLLIRVLCDINKVEEQHELANHFDEESWNERLRRFSLEYAEIKRSSQDHPEDPIKTHSDIHSEVDFCGEIPTDRNISHLEREASVEGLTGSGKTAVIEPAPTEYHSSQSDTDSTAKFGDFTQSSRRPVIKDVIFEEESDSIGSSNEDYTVRGVQNSSVGTDEDEVLLNLDSSLHQTSPELKHNWIPDFKNPPRPSKMLRDLAADLGEVNAGEGLASSTEHRTSGSQLHVINVLDGILFPNSRERRTLATLEGPSSGDYEMVYRDKFERLTLGGEHGLELRSGSSTPDGGAPRLRKTLREEEFNDLLPPLSPDPGYDSYSERLLASPDDFIDKSNTSLARSSSPSQLGVIAEEDEDRLKSLQTSNSDHPPSYDETVRSDRTSPLKSTVDSSFVNKLRENLHATPKIQDYLNHSLTEVKSNLNEKFDCDITTSPKAVTSIDQKSPQLEDTETMVRL